MESEHRLLIVEDYGSDTITIFWRNRIAQYEEEWYYMENGNFMAQSFKRKEGYAPQERKPFLVIPERLGRLFLELIGIEIDKKGFNQQKENIQVAKSEVLEKELNFTKEQLVKFVDHFTSPKI